MCRLDSGRHERSVDLDDRYGGIHALHVFKPQPNAHGQFGRHNQAVGHPHGEMFASIRKRQPGLGPCAKIILHDLVLPGRGRVPVRLRKWQIDTTPLHHRLFVGAEIHDVRGR